MGKKLFKGLTAATVAFTFAMPLGTVSAKTVQKTQVEVPAIGTANNGQLIESEGNTATNVSYGGKASEEQIIVKYKDEKSSAKSVEKVEQLGGEVVETTDEMALYKVSEENVETSIEKLEEMDNVEFVEKNTIYSIEGTVNDTYFGSQWNLEAINAPKAWEAVENTDRDDVVVAVLDTGVQSSHEDLEGRVSEEAATFVDGYEETFAGDDNGHGTFVSGIFAANSNNEKGIAGAAGNNNVKILPVKVMSKSGVGDAYNIARGIQYAIEKKVDVINLSFSGEYSESVDKAIQQAHEAGIVVVAASGNGGGNADVSYPAALPNVISVGAIAAKDQVYAGSNYGSTLDLVAPGVSVLSTSISGDLGDENGYYKTGTGTSYAAPHVAAVAALYKLENPEATATAVEEALTTTAVDMNVEGFDEKTGYGKVDALAALSDDVTISPLSFTLPKANAIVIGKTAIQAELNNVTDVVSTRFYIDTTDETNLIGTVSDTDSTTVSVEWDTTQVADGEHKIIAVTYDENGNKITQAERSVKVLNEAQSGYMFSVKTPNDTVAKGAAVQLYEKVKAKDGEYSYSSLWSGATDSEGVVRVPSHVGTDLKKLTVVVQGKFDSEEGNAWFMYSREVNSSGTVELSSDKTQAVSLRTLGVNGENVEEAQYFIKMKDEEGLDITADTAINEENATKSPVVYLDKGAYSLYSYYKQDGDTYFLTNSDASITSKTSSLVFDSRETGEIAIDNSDGKLVNAVLYLDNEDVSEIFGTSEVLTGQKFFVTAGEYDYIVDAEVKDPDGGENWIYVLTNDDQTAVVEKGGKTSIKAGGSLEISEFLPDQESLKRYYAQRGLTYIERTSPYTAYKLDGAIYTKQVFSDEYGNMLVGMYRGSVDPTNALYKKNVETGETVIMDEENTVAAINFGDLYPVYQVKRVSDGEIMLNSYTKNPTNPANRSYYFYSFWVPNSSKVTNGEYELSLTLDSSPLAPNGLNKAMTIDMQDSGVNVTLKDDQDQNKATYVTINRVEKDEHGEYQWVQAFGRNSDSTTKVLSVPSNLELSQEENGNVAIIRYTTSTGEFAYLFRQFTDLEELSVPITIPDNMQKVSISAMDGSEKLDNVSSKLWMIKKPVEVDGVTVYPTANNLQSYKKEAVYLEPGSFVIEGSYVTLPNADGEKSNYYFLENDVEIKADDENQVIFNTEELAEIKIDANTEDFKDVRGAILYPYNQYSSAFTKTLRVGHKFYVPADMEMDLQVQLGYGDPESTDYIWNYFLYKGTQTFSADEKVNWKVGGQFKASIALKDNKLKQGEPLSADTSIQDEYGNTISSVIVNKTSDYSIAENQEIVYERLANGQIVEKVGTTDSGKYQITHSGVTEASSESVKPLLRIYNKKGEIVVEQSNLDFYQSVEDLPLSLNTGRYRAELAMAASPMGPITSSEKEGLFKVTKKKYPPTTKPNGNWSSEDLTATMTKKKNGFSFTFTEEQLNTIKASDVGKVTLVTNTGVKIQVDTSEFKEKYANTLTMSLSLKKNRLIFGASTNGKSIHFSNYVFISLPKEELSAPLEKIVILREGRKGIEVVPHIVTDEGIVLKVKQGGQFKISTNKKPFHNKRS
ncbi:S8 family peptidase [Bacillus sp. FJAT-27986]|uniref:S8 family peptidase n=1 Tax=Bacillus sp. FJAT-27986 TaxID=1743146 RepID=UPI00080AE882|nr:S8 family serine peptidase [Bacillus sp. FJAT-27986]OCA88634.1 hypothetical protein A8L44_17210 [Bacillus sp. FJAT-27986]